MQNSNKEKTMITGSKELIRDINRNLILQTIIQEGIISRAALAQKTGLTKATVSSIVSDLLGQKLVLELGSDNTTMGRKPILLTFNASCGHVISLDLNNNNIPVFVSDLKGEHCQLSMHEHHLDRNTILEQLVSIISDTIASLPNTHYGVIGIGIGIHGTVFDNEVLFAPYNDYEGIPFKSYLEEKLNIPVYLENEANLSVIGEQTFCYNVPNMIGISIHSGIGVGIMIDHSLYKGINGNAGEFGHTIVARNGRLCPCGNRGCLEQYASERMILQQYQDEKELDTLTLDEFIDAYTKNDITAITLIDDFSHYMTMAINNLLATFNPDMIVVNSGFTINIPHLLTKITDCLQSRLSANCKIVPSGLQDTSTLLGASCVCIQNFLGIEHLSFAKKNK